MPARFAQLIGDSAILEAVLIVDATGVLHAASAIKHEHFRRALGADGVGQAIAGVFDERNLKRLLPGISLHLGDRVLLIGIDRQEGNPARGELLGQLVQARRVELGQRAFDPQEREHHELLVGVIGQLVLATVGVAERKLGDLPAKARCFLRRASIGGNDRQNHDRREPGRSAHGEFPL